MSMEIEKHLSSSIFNFKQIETTLSAILNLINRQEVADLQFLRWLKIIPCITEICKRIALQPKAKISEMTKSIELSIQIFKQFVIIQENWEYIISTNKIVSIVELLLWFLKMNWNGNQYSFFGITFLP